MYKYAAFLDYAREDKIIKKLSPETLLTDMKSMPMKWYVAILYTHHLKITFTISLLFFYVGDDICG